MANEQMSRAERHYARVLLGIRSGDARRKVRRIRLIAGLLAAGSGAAFVGFAMAGLVPILAFFVGALAGVSVWGWLVARHAEVRHRVVLYACDWKRVEQLANEEAAESLH